MSPSIETPLASSIHSLGSGAKLTFMIQMDAVSFGKIPVHLVSIGLTS